MSRRDFNQEPPKYNSGALPLDAEPLNSLASVYIWNVDERKHVPPASQ
jgi:hypothetical protein